VILPDRRCNATDKRKPPEQREPDNHHRYHDKRCRSKNSHGPSENPTRATSRERMVSPDAAIDVSIRPINSTAWDRRFLDRRTAGRCKAADPSAPGGGGENGGPSRRLSHRRTSAAACSVSAELTAYHGRIIKLNIVLFGVLLQRSITSRAVPVASLSLDTRVKPRPDLRPSEERLIAKTKNNTENKREYDQLRRTSHYLCKKCKGGSRILIRSPSVANVYPTERTVANISRIFRIVAQFAP